jgi:hypothetical protein
VVSPVCERFLRHDDFWLPDELFTYQHIKVTKTLHAPTPSLPLSSDIQNSALRCHPSNIIPHRGRSQFEESAHSSHLSITYTFSGHLASAGLNFVWYLGIQKVQEMEVLTS